METTYTPVPYEYRESIEEQIAKATTGKIFFWSPDNKVDEAVGRVVRMEEVSGSGIYAVLEPAARVRIDRIITLFGKPGAAYDEYDAYANACMACTAGVPL